MIIPDGEYIGDFIIIKDSSNRPIILLGWDGKTWHHNYEVFNVEE